MNSSVTVMGRRGNNMRNPLRFLFPKQDESNKSAADDEKELAREVEINRLKARNQATADEAAETIRKLTHLIEKEGISGVLFIATGADRRGGNRK